VLCRLGDGELGVGLDGVAQGGVLLVAFLVDKRATGSFIHSAARSSGWRGTACAKGCEHLSIGSYAVSKAASSLS